MGIKERKEKEKELLRSKIMEAAAQILIKEGYEKTTIRKVAEKIEYSPRTVYLYFKDKDALLMEIIEMGFKSTVEKREAIKASFDYSKPIDLLSFQIRKNIETALSSPNLYKAIVYLIQYKNYPVGTFQQKVIDALKFDLSKCYEVQNMPVSELNDKVQIVFSFIRGFNLMMINQSDLIDEQQKEIQIHNCIESIVKGVLKFK